MSEEQNSVEVHNELVEKPTTAAVDSHESPAAVDSHHSPAEVVADDAVAPAVATADAVEPATEEEIEEALVKSVQPPDGGELCYPTLIHPLV